jgi:hypothetical protein
VTRDDDRGTVTVDVEISEALAALIRREEGEDVDLGGWLADAGEFRLRQQYFHRDATVTADVPDELAERASLLAEHSRVQHGKTGIAGTREDWLADFSDLEYRWPDEDDEDGGSER